MLWWDKKAADVCLPTAWRKHKCALLLDGGVGKWPGMVVVPGVQLIKIFFSPHKHCEDER